MSIAIFKAGGREVLAYKKRDPRIVAAQINS